jgi:hypothetical protein
MAGLWAVTSRVMVTALPLDETVTSLTAVCSLVLA